MAATRNSVATSVFNLANSRIRKFKLDSNKQNVIFIGHGKQWEFAVLHNTKALELLQRLKCGTLHNLDYILQTLQETKARINSYLVSKNARRTSKKGQYLC